MLPPFVPPRDSSLQPMTQASQPPPQEASAEMQSPTDMQSPTTMVDTHPPNGQSIHGHSRSVNGFSETPTMVGPTLERQDSDESLKKKNISAETLPVANSWNLSNERKIALMILVAATHCIQFIPFALGLNVAVPIAIFFGLPGPPGGPWIAAAYPLMHVIALLPGTRLGEIWGHRNVFLLGALIWIAFHIHSGFADDYISVVVLRALSGIGSGIIEGNCVALLNLVFPPSLWKKTAFVIYGCGAATGATAGGVLVGIPAQLAIWRWSFWLLACLGGASFFLTWLVVPQDKRREPHGHFDYVGTYFYVAGLFLYDFVLNQAPAVGWKTVYIYVILIIAVLHVAAFWYWETRYALHPLMPMSIWKNKCYPPLIAVMFLTHMALGIFLWHLSLFGNTVRGYGAIATGAQLVPTAIMGCAMTVAAGVLVSRIGAKWIFHMGLTAGVVALVIFATMPAQQVYWAQAFVAAICMGLDADLVHTTGQIVVFAAVPFNPEEPRAQGVAAVLIDMFQNLGFLTGLGLAGTIESYTNDGGAHLVSGFRNTAYFAIGLCVLAAGINMVFVNIPPLGPPPIADPEKAAKQLSDGM